MPSWMGPVPEEWQIWDHPGRSEIGHCNKRTDLSNGFQFHLSWKQFFFLLLQTQGYSFLCSMLLHFKGWGWGLKGKYRTAAFKSLMCHIVPFKISPCLCCREGLRNGGQPHEMWFWIKFSLRFCILVILYLWRFFLKVYTAWKRLSTKEQLKWYLVHLNFVSYSTDDWTCCLTVLGNCFTLELSPSLLDYADSDLEITLFPGSYVLSIFLLPP